MRPWDRRLLRALPDFAAVGQAMRGDAGLQREEDVIGARNQGSDGCDLTSTRQITAVGKTWIAWASRSRPSTTIDARQINSTIDVVRARATLYNSSFKSALRLILRSATRSSSPPSPTRDASNHRHPRFRLAVHAVDCAPASRAVRLFRDSAVRHAGQRRSRSGSRSGIILSGGPKSVSEAGAPRCDRAVLRAACRCWASATACS